MSSQYNIRRNLGIVSSTVLHHEHALTNIHQQMDDIKRDMNQKIHQLQQLQQRHQTQLQTHENQIYRNEYLIDKMNMNNNKSISNTYNFNYKCGANYLFQAAEDKCLHEIILLDVSKKLSQLIVCLINHQIYILNYIEYKDGKLNFSLYFNQSCTLLEFELAQSYNTRTTWPYIIKAYNKHISKYNDYNKTLTSLSWHGRTGEYTPYKYHLNRPPQHLQQRTAVYFITAQNIASLPDGDIHKLRYCGTGQEWKNPSNYYYNGIPPPRAVPANILYSRYSFEYNIPSRNMNNTSPSQSSYIPATPQTNNPLIGSIRSNPNMNARNYNSSLFIGNILDNNNHNNNNSNNNGRVLYGNNNYSNSPSTYSGYSCERQGYIDSRNQRYNPLL